MTARDAISLINVKPLSDKAPRVDGGMHLLDVIPGLLDAPGRELRVAEGERTGIIDQTSLMEAIGRMIAPRYDCSVIELDCAPADYSASMLARAVEDCDVHLVDMFTTPGEEGYIRVTLRVRCIDPSPVVHSLERYGYLVAATYPGRDAGLTADFERLLAVQTLINV